MCVSGCPGLSHPLSVLLQVDEEPEPGLLRGTITINAVGDEQGYVLYWVDTPRTPAVRLYGQAPQPTPF